MCTQLTDYFARPGNSQAQLARQLGVTQATVSRWASNQVPAERVLPVEAATGGQVTRHDMRPDLYP